MVLRDEIGIEHRHQIAAADPESVIEIPRFGMAAVGPMPVGTAQALGQVLHLRPAAVIQHPNLRTLVGLTTAPREAPLQHRDRFSAGRDEDRHLRSPLACLYRAHGLIRLGPSVGNASPGQPHRQESADQQPAFRHQQREAEGAGNACGHGQACRAAPVQVAQGQHSEQHDQRPACPDRTLLFATTGQHHRNQQKQTGQELHLKGDAPVGPGSAGPGRDSWPRPPDPSHRSAVGSGCRAAGSL